MSQSPPLLLLLAVTCCLLGRCSCQRTYFCDTDDRDNITDSDFYLVTRNEGSLHYEPRINCSFSAASGIYWIEVLTVDVGSLMSLTVDRRQLLRGHRVSDYNMTMMTRGEELRVEFQSRSDYAGSRQGAKLRVRAVSSQGCPPGWSNYTRLDSRNYCLTGHCCIGSSSSNLSLPFREAQQACTSMRANLLMLTSPILSSMKSILPVLPSHLRHDTWIGLTDLESHRSYRWLNRWSYMERNSITCNGGSYKSCHLSQRCGLLTKRPRYEAEMQDCSDRRRFVCVMPAGGARTLYSVPSQRGTAQVRRNIRWFSIVGSCIFFGLFLLTVGVLRRLRQLQRRQQRQQQQRLVVWAVTQPPVATATPAYPKPPPYDNFRVGSPPPSYSQALQQQGQRNHAFAS